MIFDLVVDDEENSRWHNLSVMRSIFVTNVVILLMKICMIVSKTLINIFIYATVCDTLYPDNNEQCSEPDSQQNIAHLAAFYILFQKISLNVPAFILSPFFGKWTDYIGRKIPSLLPIAGNMIGILVYILASTLLPRYALLVILIGSVVRGLSGKSQFVMTALQSYVVDICPRDKLASGLGTFIATSMWGFSVGLVAMGLLLDWTSFTIIFCSLLVLMTVCILLILVFIHDVPKDNFLLKQENKSRNLEAILKSPFVAIFKQREGNKRCQLISFLLLTFLYQTCRVGQEDVLLLYLQRPEFAGRESSYAYILATGYAVKGLSLISILPLGTNIFHINDTAMMVMALLTQVVGFSILGFTQNMWMLYLGIIVGTPSAIFASISKSTISKLVSQEEIGMVFGVVTSLEIISSISGSGIFIYTYLMTSSYFMGTAYLIMAGVVVLMMMVVLIVPCLSANKEETLKAAIQKVKKYDGEKAIEKQFTDITVRKE